MRQVDHLDSSTRFCECGESFTWSGYDPELRPWMNEHEPHAMKTYTVIYTISRPVSGYRESMAKGSGLPYPPFEDPNIEQASIMTFGHVAYVNALTPLQASARCERDAVEGWSANVHAVFVGRLVPDVLGIQITGNETMVHDFTEKESGETSKRP